GVRVDERDHVADRLTLGVDRIEDTLPFDHPIASLRVRSTRTRTSCALYSADPVASSTGAASSAAWAPASRTVPGSGSSADMPTSRFSAAAERTGFAPTEPTATRA